MRGRGMRTVDARDQAIPNGDSRDRRTGGQESMKSAPALHPSAQRRQDGRQPSSSDYLDPRRVVGTRSTATHWATPPECSRRALADHPRGSRDNFAAGSQAKARGGPRTERPTDFKDEDRPSKIRGPGRREGLSGHRRAFQSTARDRRGVLAKLRPAFDKNGPTVTRAPLGLLNEGRRPG